MTGEVIYGEFPLSNRTKFLQLSACAYTSQKGLLNIRSGAVALRKYGDDVILGRYKDGKVLNSILTDQEAMDVLAIMWLKESKPEALSNQTKPN